MGCSVAIFFLSLSNAIVSYYYAITTLVTYYTSLYNTPRHASYNAGPDLQQLHHYVRVFQPLPPQPLQRACPTLRRLVLDSEDTQGVSVSRSRFPTAQAHHSRAVFDAAQLAAPVDASNEALLHVYRPAGTQWLVIQQGVQPSVHVALQGKGGQQDGEGRWREHTYIDEALSECALTILAVLASLVMEMMGQRGRNFASRKAVLDAETGWE